MILEWLICQNPEKNLKHYAKAKNPLGNKGMTDAQKYIGRGFLQITGKYNYKHFGDLIRPGLGDELLKNPNTCIKNMSLFKKENINLIFFYLFLT